MTRVEIETLKQPFTQAKFYFVC